MNRNRGDPPDRGSNNDRRAGAESAENSQRGMSHERPGQTLRDWYDGNTSSNRDTNHVVRSCLLKHKFRDNFQNLCLSPSRRSGEVDDPLQVLKARECTFRIAMV